MTIASKNVTSSGSPGNRPVTSEEVLTAELVLLTILSLCILFGNGLVCIAFVMDRKLQTTTNRFVVCLACSDILVGVVIIPLYMYIKTANFVLNHMIYETWMALEITACSSSIASLVAISIERCISVTMPAFHHNISRRSVCISIAIIWCHSVFTSGSLIYFYAGKDRAPWMALYRTIASFFLPLLVILINYGVIFKVAVTRGRRRNPRLSKDLRTAITIAIVNGAFVSAWLPFNALTIVAAYYPTAPVDWSLALILVKWLKYLNSIINPIIYSFCNHDFRFAFLKLLRRIDRQNPRTVIPRRRHETTTRAAGSQGGMRPGKTLARSKNEASVAVSSV